MNETQGQKQKGHLKHTMCLREPLKTDYFMTESHLVEVSVHRSTNTSAKFRQNKAKLFSLKN